MFEGDWIQYKVQHPADKELTPVLVRYRHLAAATPGDHGPLEEKIWMERRNKPLLVCYDKSGNVMLDSRGQPNSASRYHIDQVREFLLPPRFHAPNIRQRTYTATGSEASLADVVKWIADHHGAGSLEPTAEPLKDVTADYLYQLFENLPYAQAHPTGTSEAPVAGDKIVYFVKPRPLTHRDVAPSTDVAAHTNAILSDQPAFKVSASLSMPSPEMKLLSDTCKSFRQAKVTFSVTIARNGNADPYRTTFRVLQPDRTVYYEETHTDGDWIKLGTRDWQWDGFSSADDAEAVLDTRVLRGNLTLQVVVEPVRGVTTIHEYHLANQAKGGKYADLKVFLGEGRIEVELYIRFERVTSDFWLWFAAILGLAILFAAVTFLVWFIDWAIDALQGIDGHEKAVRDRNNLTTDAAIIMLAAELIVLIVAVVGLQLSTEDYEKAQGILLEGIGIHWSRLADFAVTVGGTQFVVAAKGTSNDDKGATYALASTMFGSRGVNLGMIIPVFPTIIPCDLHGAGFSESHMRYTGAHEIGHLVLADDRDRDYSIRHKGTTGNMFDQSVLDTADKYPDSPAEIDLMKYYRESTTAGERYGRWMAAEEDIIRLFRVATIEWREASTATATLAGASVTHSAPNDGVSALPAGTANV